VARAEWGLKRICPQCGTRYYDMKKKPPVCPQCGAVFDAETTTKARRPRSAEDKAQRNAPRTDDIEDIAIASGDEADMIEDIDELEEESVDDVVDIEGESESERT